MIFKAALSTDGDTRSAAKKVCLPIMDMQPDLACLFASHHHAAQVEELVAEVWDRANARNLIGCLGESVIGPDREIEQAPAVSRGAAQLPGVRGRPCLMDQSDVENFATREDWLDRLGLSPNDKPNFILLPEPFSVDVEHCLRKLDDTFPDAVTIGGMASGGTSAGENKLFLNDQVFRQGVVGVSLAGAVGILPVVSQGCRPVGEPFVITKAEKFVIQELRGRPAVDVLREVFSKAPRDDQELMQSGVHVGKVVAERAGRFGRGDFLIRNLMGIVGDSALAVNALVRPGQTVQFHVRDSRTADEDMQSLLADKIADLPKPPGGGLLFSCNGRGTRLFGKPNHDIAVINRLVEECQVAGFFAGGEIGPIGRQTFIHGFTSSLALFHELK